MPIRVLLACLCLLCCLSRATAQPATTSRPFEIMDNSFLVEEAFNQEPGIFQNILGAYLVNGSDWQSTFTQEWPVLSQKHQFSYTLPFVSTVDSQRGFGDLLLNYRLQAWMEGPGRPAFSPRVSLIVPTGSSHRGLGDGAFGIEVNMPFSKQRGDLYFHWNGGFSLLPGAYAGQDDSTQARIEHNLFSPFLAGSAIVRVRPMLNVMVESVIRWEHGPDATLARTTHDAVAVVSPGLRGGWDIGEQQLILGVAIPVTVTSSEDRVGIFGYVSYELPFMKPQPQPSTARADRR